ncbi:C-type lectin lectoxin-Lio2-like [Ostrea edulis]|uniref:C-type lectin lectoxin-Lio2-like n=1 Tax=Ostrea edulis TaxID=37623 RepID=UPI0024AEA8E2|nr:C-type lectin lectoxin-Lio2-like [Ostrea edulis]
MDDEFRVRHICRDFEFHSKKLSWDDARSYCRIGHGSLVTVDDANTQEFLYILFLYRAEVTFTDYWIGLHKTDSQQWRWTNGQIFNYSSWYYRPINAISGQSCAKLLSTERLKWIYSDCHETSGFICEYQPKRAGLEVAVTVSGQTETTVEECGDRESLPEHWMWVFYSGAVLIVLLIIVIISTCCVNCGKTKTSKTVPATERVSCPNDPSFTHYAFI